MKEELIAEIYEIAKERYTTLGVDVERVVEQLQKVVISVHCWQTDDIIGFGSGGSLTDGIQTTGNHPGKAHNMEELHNDISEAASYIPGKHRLNLHEIYSDFDGVFVDHNQVEAKHLGSWMQRVVGNGMEPGFNSAPFSHSKSGNLSLSNSDKGICDFRIEHIKCCRAIVEEMRRRQGGSCIVSPWAHDGSKNVMVNCTKYRKLFKDSLDWIFAMEYRNVKDYLESKVSGTGLESYTVGSDEFCVGYSVQHQKPITIDTGHFRPTESAADKVPSILLFVPELMFHVSRPTRWDSDHVTIMDDSMLELSQEIVRCNALDRVHIGLDYFDAPINRTGAYVIDTRAAQGCMLRALSEPLAKLREYKAAGQNFQCLTLLEEAKTLPRDAAWSVFYLKNNVSVGEEFTLEIEKYEVEVTSKRN